MVICRQLLVGQFRVSLDNLTGEGGDGSRFKDHVFAQVQAYFSGGSSTYHVMRNTSLTVFAYVLVLEKHYRAMNFKEKCSTKFQMIHI